MANEIQNDPATAGAEADLLALVERGQQRRSRFLLLQAVGLQIAVPLAYLWAVFWLDNVLHFSVGGRILANVVFVAAVLLLAWRAVRRWRDSRYSADEAALAIEQRSADRIDNRLINAIQLARHEDQALSATVVKENQRVLRTVQLAESTDRWPALLPLLAAVLLIGAGVLLWVTNGQRFTNAAARIFMPLAKIEPVYDTRLSVSPGDVDAAVGQDVEIVVQIDGEIPESLWLVREEKGELTSERIPVAAGSRQCRYTVTAVRQSLNYAWRGGDFATRRYRIEVPTVFSLRRISGVFQYPGYTGLPDRSWESTSGDLEALFQTRASLRFLLGQPADSMSLRLSRPLAETSGDGQAADDTVRLIKTGPAEFAGDIVFDNVTGYVLEVRPMQGDATPLGPYLLRVAVDRPPTMELTGITARDEVMFDAVGTVEVRATDDYGLAEVGLFYRLRTDVADGGQEQDWQPAAQWQTPGAVDFKQSHALAFNLLAAAEGERIELAVRARDNAPLREPPWTCGELYQVKIVGPGSALQTSYESILRTEVELRGLIAALSEQIGMADEWIGKLKPSSGLRWDDGKNLAALADAINDQAARQAAQRKAAALTASKMVAETGTLKITVGMLADTEMVRCVLMLESVLKRDHPQAMRAALADARLTEERCRRSLGEVLNAYVDFRQNWELSHMLSFTKMLADRQERMARASLSYAGLQSDLVGELQRQAVNRRQLKLRQLAELTQTAFAGMAERQEAVGELLAGAFLAASRAFTADGILAEMQTAADGAAAGDWAGTAAAQQRATDGLLTIYRDVRKAQARASREALQDLSELTESNVEAQQTIEKLKAGDDENMIEDYEDTTTDDVVFLRRLAESLRQQKHPSAAERQSDFVFEEYMRDELKRWQGSEDQQLANLRLASEPGSSLSTPGSSDLPGDKVSRPKIQDAYDDLVGDLLEEADELRDDYETYNLNAEWKTADPGNIGKQAGDMNSNVAAAPTGNMKPPVGNFGGASRSGRQGARAHGLSVSEESINRRGRDEAQEGQEEVPDQPGEKKETLSDDPQTDTSTGVGGKKVGEEKSSFSLKDAGEWKDEMVERLSKPKGVNQIVERKGQPMDHRLAELMHDMASSQEQVIERIKTLKKELDQLYLPTDHLDDLIKKLTNNFEQLRNKPDAEVFRRQIETLDQLKSTVVVFNRAPSAYEASVPREQTIKGRVLDEPASPAPPAYREAVELYYKKLSGL